MSPPGRSIPGRALRRPDHRPALRAATLTVDPAFRLHSLHAYFIRLGDAAEPIRLEVDRIRNGRTFLTWRVVARQAVGAILNLSSSFQVPEAAVEVQTEQMPTVAAPESPQADSWSPLIDRRLLPTDIGPGRVGAWMRLPRRSRRSGAQRLRARVSLR